MKISILLIDFFLAKDNQIGVNIFSSVLNTLRLLLALQPFITQNPKFDHFKINITIYYPLYG